VHAACNQSGKPVRFFITGGQRSDYRQALGLIAGKRMKVLIADKGYDASYMVEAGEKVGAKVVIPPRKNRKVQREYDKELYKERNIIERMFNKMKHFRRVATRYDKLAVTYLGFVFFVAACLWLN
jgi:transposase